MDAWTRACTSASGTTASRPDASSPIWCSRFLMDESVASTPTRRTPGSARSMSSMIASTMWTRRIGVWAMPAFSASKRTGACAVLHGTPTTAQPAASSIASTESIGGTGLGAEGSAIQVERSGMRPGYETSATGRCSWSAWASVSSKRARTRSRPA